MKARFQCIESKYDHTSKTSLCRHLSKVTTSCKQLLEGPQWVWQDAGFNIFWGVIFGMQIKNRSGKCEFQLRVGEGFRGFERPGCENRKGVKWWEMG